MSRPPFTPAQLKREVLPDLLGQIAAVQRHYIAAYGTGYGRARTGEGGRVQGVSDPTGDLATSIGRDRIRRSVRRTCRDLEKIGVLFDKVEADLMGALGHVDPRTTADLKHVDQYRVSRAELQASLEAKRRRLERGEEAV